MLFESFETWLRGPSGEAYEGEAYELVRSFDPDKMRIVLSGFGKKDLLAAYAAALLDIQFEQGHPTQEPPGNATCLTVALRIIEASANGERDASRLKQLALHDLMGSTRLRLKSHLATVFKRKEAVPSEFAPLVEGALMATPVTVLNRPML